MRSLDRENQVPQPAQVQTPGVDTPEQPDPWDIDGFLELCDEHGVPGEVRGCSWR